MLSEAEGERRALEASADDVRVILVASGGAHDQLRALDGALSAINDITASLRQAAAFPGTVSPMGLAQLQASLTVTLQSAGTIARAAQAEAATRTAEASAARLELTHATAATREAVKDLQHDLFERKIFDPYLHFGSEEDERAYREREAERQRYIAEQQAKGTPQGAINAAGAAQGQMLDAYTYGAGDSPEWQSRWEKLAVATRRQRAAMVAAGQSTEEYDQNITRDVRRFLKGKGLSDAEIEARLASGTDPLEGVKPYLGKDEGTRALETKLDHSAPATALNSDARERAPASSAPQAAGQPEPSALPGLDDAMAKLKAAGATVSDTPTTDHGLHGVSSGRAPAQNTPA